MTVTLSVSLKTDTLTDLWARAVERQPAAPAVVDDHSTLTYRELDAYSDAVARDLRAAGVGPEAPVALHLRRGVGLFAGILGVLKAGGAYVAVDPRYPAARRQAMIDASGARVVLTERDWTADATAETVRALTPYDEYDLTETADFVPAVADPRSAACILFTSGSAGQPKATVLEHRGIVGFARNQALPELTADDRVGQIASPSFDAFHFETWCAFAHGAQIVVLPALPDLLASDLRRTLRRLRITAMLVPTMAVNHVVREDRDAFSPLRILHTGGDAILAGTCRDLLAGSFSGRFFNLYGPTEATTACTAFEVTAVAPEASSIPIGTAVEGAHIYVLDEASQPVAPGQVGQLHVGGRGVARGYLGDPSLTASRFLPDPFQADGGRMYATGDLVRVLPDGMLDFVGRADHQVKIRGYRVEPGEVERVLQRHPQVRDAAVLPHGHDQDRNLVAFVVRRGPLQPAELRAFAERELPDHMVPAKIVILTKIPATDNGKRDRQALIELLESDEARVRAHQPPASPAERLLAKIWSTLLATEDIGVTDDFFVLGGNSMLAFRVRQQIKRETGVAVDIGVILENSVLRDLAAVLDARTEPGAGS
ncbi:non-ribosomal peptide synthetase [Catenulispora subtropica]|uniref:Carrier domain-containing protein n=1 Tax=Catenulispora subtropica TaxID=450798 RepID=A0ABP5DNH9_9ACTN